MADTRGWKPIETAPRDGTRILVYREGYAEPVAVCWWSKAFGDWLSVPGAYAWRPDKWRPLPQLPESEK